MSKKNDWNPENYLKFRDERTQPAIDLVNRIELRNPQNIIDIGCGPGNSTEILKSRWPDAKVKGIDNSPMMIQKAIENHPDQEWEIKDVNDIDTCEKYDLVFSNAVIQWIPDHNLLLNKILQSINSNGVLAIQMPLYHEMPISSLIDKTYKELFDDDVFNINDIFTFHSSNYYFNLLYPVTEKLDLWETSYFHIMDSDEHIYEMIKTTGMKPYFDIIGNKTDQDRFTKEVKTRIAQMYKREAAGKVIFPFKRMFIVAYK